MKKDEDKLQPIRHRSTAATKNRFEFCDGYQNSIVPIYKFSNEGTIELVGTGFFVANGIIVHNICHSCIICFFFSFIIIIMPRSESLLILC